MHSIQQLAVNQGRSAVSNIVQAGTEFRVYAALALSKLSWRLCLDGLRIKSVHSVANLRHVAGIDGCQAYRRMASAAAALGAAYGSDAPQRLAALLCGIDPAS
jgi:hypothetical protein